MTVWKFTLRPADRLQIDMPAGAQILHVAEQFGSFCMWALVDPDAPRTTRHFTVAGTGHAVPNGASHVGSVLMHEGALVWHVFEVEA